MRASNKALDEIKRWEKCELVAYQDEGGVWTLGYGETGAHITKGLHVTPSEAEGWLVNRTDSLSSSITDLVRVPLKQHQFDALVSLAYNIGITAFAHSTLLKLLNQGFPEKAAEEFIKWDHVKGKEVPGLRSRRMAERSLFLHGY